MILLSSTRFYSSPLDPIRFRWVLLDSTPFYSILLHSTRFYFILLAGTAWSGPGADRVETSLRCLERFRRCFERSHPSTPTRSRFRGMSRGPSRFTQIHQGVSRFIKIYQDSSIFIQIYPDSCRLILEVILWLGRSGRRSGRRIGRRSGRRFGGRVGRRLVIRTGFLGPNPQHAWNPQHV